MVHPFKEDYDIITALIPKLPDGQSFDELYQAAPFRHRRYKNIKHTFLNLLNEKTKDDFKTSIYKGRMLTWVAFVYITLSTINLRDVINEHYISSSRIVTQFKDVNLTLRDIVLENEITYIMKVTALAEDMSINMRETLDCLDNEFNTMMTNAIDALYKQYLQPSLRIRATEPTKLNLKYKSRHNETMLTFVQNGLGYACVDFLINQRINKLLNTLIMFTCTNTGDAPIIPIHDEEEPDPVIS